MNYSVPYVVRVYGHRLYDAAVDVSSSLSIVRQSEALVPRNNSLTNKSTFV